jgi:hypothetical protein
VALDGKAVRGAGTAEQAAPHLLSASTHGSGETLVQVRVSEKTNEVPVARDLLPALPLAGRVVTADALHTYAQTAQAILDQEADYLWWGPLAKIATSATSTPPPMPRLQNMAHT